MADTVSQALFDDYADVNAVVDRNKRRKRFKIATTGPDAGVGDGTFEFVEMVSDWLASLGSADCATLLAGVDARIGVCRKRRRISDGLFHFENNKCTCSRQHFYRIGKSCEHCDCCDKNGKISVADFREFWLDLIEMQLAQVLSGDKVYRTHAIEEAVYLDAVGAIDRLDASEVSQEEKMRLIAYIGRAYETLEDIYEDNATYDSKTDECAAIGCTGCDDCVVEPDK